MKLSGLNLSKRNLGLGLLGLTTVILTLISYWPSQKSPSQVVPSELPAVSSNEKTFEFLPAPTPTPLNNIQVQQLESDGIKLENLYQGNPTPDFRSDTTLIANKDYSILFFAGELLFQLTIYTQPFTETQKIAEEALLSQLKISQAQACQLKVSIVKQSNDPTQAPVIENKLSFCP